MNQFILLMPWDESLMLNSAALRIGFALGTITKYAQGSLARTFAGMYALKEIKNGARIATLFGHDWEFVIDTFIEIVGGAQNED